MRQYILIQHTQSVHHINGMVGGWSDWELTELGREQASKIGKSLLRELNDQKFVMYNSDLLRAKETADIIGSILQITPICRQELREINLGSAKEKSVRWLNENKLNRDEGTKAMDYRVLADSESKYDHCNRLLPFFQEMQHSKEKNIMIVAHGGTINLFLSLWLTGDMEKLEKFEVYGRPGAVSIVEEQDDGIKIVRKINDLSYVNS